MKARLEAEVAASKKRNSSAWRLRQENDEMRQQKAQREEAEASSALHRQEAGAGHEAEVVRLMAQIERDGAARQELVVAVQQAEDTVTLARQRDAAVQAEIQQERQAHRRTQQQRWRASTRPATGTT